MEFFCCVGLAASIGKHIWVDVLNELSLGSIVLALNPIFLGIHPSFLSAGGNCR